MAIEELRASIDALRMKVAGTPTNEEVAAALTPRAPFNRQRVVNMDDDSMIELARGAVEQNLGADFVDMDGQEPTPDQIYDDAYVLAFDKLHDAGVGTDDARRIAQQVAMMFAQP